jgi:hypothetical protein
MTCPPRQRTSDSRSIQELGRRGQNAQNQRDHQRKHQRGIAPSATVTPSFSKYQFGHRGLEIEGIAEIA